MIYRDISSSLDKLTANCVSCKGWQHVVVHYNKGGLFACYLLVFTRDQECNKSGAQSLGSTRVFGGGRDLHTYVDDVLADHVHGFHHLIL
jgi:hypothetical protein